MSKVRFSEFASIARNYKHREAHKISGSRIGTEHVFPPYPVVAAMYPATAGFAWAAAAAAAYERAAAAV